MTPNTPCTQSACTRTSVVLAHRSLGLQIFVAGQPEHRAPAWAITDASISQPQVAATGSI